MTGSNVEDTVRGKRFVFLTMNDMTRDGGGPVRIYGLLNALAGKGCEVTLLSNSTHIKQLGPDVRNIFIGRKFTPGQKRMIQALVAWLPAWAAALFFRRTLRLTAERLGGAKEIYSFEYLDNTLAYLLKKQGFIDRYVNDIHGMAPLEFESQIIRASNLLDRLRFKLKRLSARKLDRKVFSSASGLIYASDAMQEYYERNIISGKKPASIILPFVSGGDVNGKPDQELAEALREKYSLSAGDFVFLFAGSYKATGGVDWLIDAFERIRDQEPRVKLMLIGNTGPMYQHCMRKVRQSEYRASIITIEKIPYSQLLTYQSLANVVVCPDQANNYSEYIIHTKYFDAMWSDKPVINGNFAAVRQINPDERLSLSFDPSSPDDLYRTMKRSVDDYARLSEKYARTSDYLRKNLTYPSLAGRLVEFNGR